MFDQLGALLKRQTQQLRELLTPKAKIVHELNKKERKADLSNDSIDDLELYFNVTTSKKDIIASQRLRYRVFSEEYGAQFKNKHDLDLDKFDKYCSHLVVKNQNDEGVVAYTRLLTQKQMIKAGKWYSEHEFDLGNLAKLDGKVLEIGRTCVHPKYRSGAAINTLWQGIAHFSNTYEARYLIGCASIPLLDGGKLIEELMPKFRREYFVDEALRVTPHTPFDFGQAGSKEAQTTVKIPPLLKAYLRLGAKIGGEPFWDKEFNCVDLFILIDVENISPRYKERFFN